MSPSPSITETLGSAVGRVVAPLFTWTSELRHARTFHPRGDLVDAMVDVHPEVAPGDRELAETLRGPALIRLSDALSKGKARWPDVLGCAVRFGASLDHLEGTQDLLFATIRRPWTMAFAPFTTHVGDYLENDYFAVSPFDAPGHRRVYFRLHPVSRSGDATPQLPAPQARRFRLTRLVGEGRARLDLGISEHPFGPFRPMTRIALLRVAEDQPANLHFDAFAAGKGIEPRGFVHALRKSVYASSQEGRAMVGEGG